MENRIHTLSNNLRIVHLHVPKAQAAHFGIAVRAGSSHEQGKKEYGLAHFVEHTLFKGTMKRSSWHIINRMENVGGELNAFTTKEDTVIYSAFPKNALSRAVELITDLILNSRFPQAEIERERGVICDEINSYLDSPAEAVYDDFEDTLYAQTPLGHNILGTLKTVSEIDSGMCRQWLARHYFAENMVAFYAGPTPLETFLKKTERYLLTIPQRNHFTTQPVTWRQAEAFSLTKKNETHQAHTVVGCALPRLSVEERVTLALLTNILGGPGMNSIFNVELRERRGLVYNVESTMTNWNYSTMFTTYFGCDVEDNTKCISLIAKEITRIADGGINARKLSAARKQYRGQMILSRENIENRIIGIARSLLHNGRVMTIAETNILLDAITPESLGQMALRLLPLSYLTIMPK